MTVLRCQWRANTCPPAVPSDPGIVWLSSLALRRAFSRIHSLVSHRIRAISGRLCQSVGRRVLRSRRTLSQRACTARRIALLRSSGLTLRQRAAPKPTAWRCTGSTAIRRLVMSRISRARSSSASGGRFVCFMIRRRRIERRTPSMRMNSLLRSGFAFGVCGVLDIRMLV